MWKNYTAVALSVNKSCAALFGVINVEGLQLHYETLKTFINMQSKLQTILSDTSKYFSMGCDAEKNVDAGLEKIG